MAENSKIEWTDHTFNAWIGCTAVSAACDFCYAEALTDRYGLVEWGPHADRRRTSAANWAKVRRWNRAAADGGKRAKVFCSSLADVFDNHKSILPKWREDLWCLIEETPNLDWLLLTKRPQNIHRFIPAEWAEEGCPDNVWLGVTVENQDEADRRIPALLNVICSVHFLSMEPLLGPVNIEAYIHDSDCDLDASDGKGCMCIETGGPFERTVDWVIVGGESGPQARPSNPQWFRDIRDQCSVARVPFLFKQWGEWGPDRGPGADGKDPIIEGKARCVVFDAPFSDVPLFYANGYGVPAGYVGKGSWAYRLGKKRAGRELDGVTHDGFPFTKRHDRLRR